MKQIIIKRLLFVLLYGCLFNVSRAQDFNVIDINRSTDSYPQNYQQSTGKNQFAVLDGIVSFFEANDGIHGTELWRSDGTTGGTFMLKDIKAGPGGSNPTNIITSGGKIYFSANDSIHGNELWVSDGTRDGTRLVKDISADIGSANPTYLTDVNGTVYFFTDYGSSSASELWKTDGTKEGTVLAANFFSDQFSYGSNASYLVNANGQLFFSLYNYGSGYQLWTSNGTKDGTSKLTNINTGNYLGCYPLALTAVKGLLCFAANDSAAAYHLYISDGTPTGTYPAKNKDEISVYAYAPFIVRNNTIIFAGSTNNSGLELCKYNILYKSHNVILIKDIVPGINSSNPDNFINVDSTVYFTAYSGKDYSLWKTDGSKEGTVLVKDINPGGPNYYTNFTAVKNKLMFSFYNDALGYELWQSDGTGSGTAIVKDIYPGVYSSSTNNFTPVNDFMLFGADDGRSGEELWKSDGTEQGTFLLKDINRSATSSSFPFTYDGYDPGVAKIVSSNKKLLFCATDGQSGNDELYASDGTASGTYAVKDIDSGSGGSYPGEFVNLDKSTYFFAAQAGYYQIWKTDGTFAGTSFISVPILDSEYANLESVVATDNLLYIFTFNYSTYQQEIWRSDGTSKGTYLLQSLNPYYSLNPVAAGNTIFFINYDDASGIELWKSDGTMSGTGLVKDIVPGSGGSSPNLLTAYKGKLYFNAQDENYNYYLWSSDGTEGGTKALTSVFMWPNFKPIEANGKLFFYGFGNDDYSYELWATNGTASGTKIVKDINGGPYSSLNSYYDPVNNASNGSLLFFDANDGIHGDELWKSDGTAKGTKLVKDITPGADGTLLSYFGTAGGKLYFINNGSLWASDGTANGTLKVNDSGLDGVTFAANPDFTEVGNKLCFTAYAAATGQELYSGDTVELPHTFAAKTPLIPPVAGLINNLDEITIYPNPVTSVLNISMSLANSKAGILSISDLSGKVLLRKNSALPKGSLNQQFDVSRYPAGTYFLKIVSSDGKLNVVQKFVKE